MVLVFADQELLDLHRKNPSAWPKPEVWLNYGIKIFDVIFINQIFYGIKHKLRLLIKLDKPITNDKVFMQSYI